MYTAPRGTQDILPIEQKYWHYVISKAEDIAKRYGFARIDTPLFEETALFHRSVGEVTDIVEKETYDFKDKGGGYLTLRPEGTAPVARAYIEHGLFNEPKPLKLYYIAPAFRYDRPQKGRFRQHYQFGGEILGDAHPLADGETISMLWQLYQELALKNIVFIINSIGCAQCRPFYLKALKDYYTKNIDGMCPDCKCRFEKNILRLLDCKEEKCASVAQKAPRSTDYLCLECQTHHNTLKAYLADLKISFRENHRLVRGLDYYNRTVFEAVPQDSSGQQSSIGGGGRYDNLVEQLGGPPTPALGFGTGLERIILNLKEQRVAIFEIYHIDVYIAIMGSDGRQQGLLLATNLRQQGYRVLLGSGEKSLKAQMKQADKSGAKWALIIGEEEAQQKTVILKALQNQQEQQNLEQKALGNNPTKYLDKPS